MGNEEKFARIVEPDSPCYGSKFCIQVNDEGEWRTIACFETEPVAKMGCYDIQHAFAAAVKKRVDAAKKCDSCGGTDLVCYKGHETTVSSLRKQIREAKDAVWEEAARMVGMQGGPDSRLLADALLARKSK